MRVQECGATGSVEIPDEKKQMVGWIFKERRSNSPLGAWSELGGEPAGGQSVKNKDLGGRVGGELER